MRTITTHLTDHEVLEELGERLRGFRLQQNLIQGDLARRAGLGWATVQRAEQAGRCSLATLVAILRGLGRLDALESFLPRPLTSPIQLAKLRGKPRVRARAATTRKVTPKRPSS